MKNVKMYGRNLPVDSKTVEDAYDKEALLYEDFMKAEMKYQVPERTSSLTQKYISKDRVILEIGVGTGLIGELLSNLKYSNLWGNDISEKMLNQSKSKGIYVNLVKHDLYDPLPYEDNSFDAIIGAGVLAFIDNADVLMRELARCTKTDGYIILSNRIDRMDDFGYTALCKKMEESGLWECVHSDIFCMGPGIQLYVDNKDLWYYEWVYKML